MARKCFSSRFCSGLASNPKYFLGFVQETIDIVYTNPFRTCPRGCSYAAAFAGPIRDSCTMCDRTKWLTLVRSLETLRHGMTVANEGARQCKSRRRQKNRLSRTQEVSAD